MFFSSHQLGEVEAIADHIGIIDRGKMVVSGSLDDMKARYQRIRVVLQDGAQAPDRWVDGVESEQREGRVVSLLASRNADGIAEQAGAIAGASVERFPVTLKEIFLEHVRSH
jgi:ABC-2 type transport system ATP-binding protein